jgi:cytoskeleton protein RodZ
MTLIELAGILKVQVQKLQALESGHLGAFKDVVFLRALTASVCRVLKMDSVPVLALLPPSPVDFSVLRPAENRAEPLRQGPIIRQPLTEQISMHTVVLVIFFLLGTLVLLFFPRERTEGGESSVTKTSLASAVLPVSGVSESSRSVASGLLSTLGIAPGSVPASIPASVSSGLGSMSAAQGLTSGLPSRSESVMPLPASSYVDLSAQSISSPRRTEVSKPIGAVAGATKETSSIAQAQGRGPFVIGAAALASDRLTQSR